MFFRISEKSADLFPPGMDGRTSSWLMKSTKATIFWWWGVLSLFLREEHISSMIRRRPSELLTHTARRKKAACSQGPDGTDSAFGRSGLGRMLWTTWEKSFFWLSKFRRREMVDPYMRLQSWRSFKASPVQRIRASRSGPRRGDFPPDALSAPSFRTLEAWACSAENSETKEERYSSTSLNDGAGAVFTAFEPFPARFGASASGLVALRGVSALEGSFPSPCFGTASPPFKGLPFSPSFAHWSCSCASQMDQPAKRRVRGSKPFLMTQMFFRALTNTAGSRAIALSRAWMVCRIPRLGSVGIVARISASMAVCRVALSSRIFRTIAPTRAPRPLNKTLRGILKTSGRPPAPRNSRARP